MFITFHNHYLSKISELKKPSAKVKIKNLINYSTVCCRSESPASPLPLSLKNKIK
jgi:hypothetical protein